MWVRSILNRVTAPSNRSATRAANRHSAARRLRMESLEGRSLLAVVASDDVYAAVEDTPLVVAAPGVLDNDANSNEDDLSAILVDNPGHGTLSLNSDGSFSYTPNVNFFGTDTFTYQASDGQVDSNIAAVTINVTPVNDPPIGANGTVTMAEDTLYPLSVADFGFSDPADAPPNNFLAVRITALPAAGTLIVGGFPVFPGQVVPVSSILSGQMRFTPAINANGSPYASFAFQVQDNGGTANGGVDFDPSPNTLTINVTPVNDPPFGANGTVTMAEDTLYTFQVADFNFIDPADFPPNSLAAVRITSLPAAGTLTVFGIPAGLGQVVPVSLIVSGQMRFTPAINANGSPYASFAFQVQDNGGTANGGVDFDPSPNTLTINVTPVNDAPVADDDSYSTSQGTPLTVPAAGVLENDSDVDGDSLSAALATGPSHGAVTLNPDGSFTYTPDSTFSGTDTFTYTVNDGNGGTDTATVSIDVAAAAPGSVVTITDSCLGGTALLITGTSGNDNIDVTPGPGGTLTVTVDGVIHSVAAPSGWVIVVGGDGDDDIQVAGGVANSVWLYGDAGNDLLNAGNGGSLIIGGTGNDVLLGGGGRDILIGGEGADTLTANGNDDILVAGLTNFDLRSTAGHEEFWCDVWSEWTSANSFAARVQNLRDGTGGNAHNNGLFLFPNVVDDLMAGSIDTLIGGAGSDWLLFEAGEDIVTGPAEASN
jgi:VCBS repeat-containing protein